MLSDSLFCKLRTTGRENGGHDFYASQMAAEIDDKCNGQLMDPNNSVYDLGLDFCQVFAFKTHSSGLLLMRSTDIPVAQRSKRRFTYILAVIPGHSEPKSMDVYLSPTLEAFKCYGPNGEGLNIEDCTGNKFNHKIFLSGIYADTPANRKLSLWNSHASGTGCGHCLLKGHSKDSGGMFFPGHASPVEVNTVFNDVNPAALSPITAALSHIPVSAQCGDPLIKVSHNMHVMRVLLAEVQPDKAPVLGCKGLSPVIRELDYCDYNNVFVVPICHASLLGVTKRFWSLCLGQLGRYTKDFSIRGAQRNIMMQRAGHLIMTNDLNRPYRDIVAKRGTWTMEDWLRWVDCYSIYILHDSGTSSANSLLPTVIREVNGTPVEFNLGTMWFQFRTALLHYLRYDPTDFSEDANDRAAKELASFSSAAEHVFGLEFCTYNLHLLGCRLRDQERARGHVSFAMEFWVERGMQSMKSDVKYRSPVAPEVTFVGTYLTKLTLAHLKAEYTEQLKSFDEWIPKYRADNVRLDAS
ncbi:hypothetical protein Vafri_20814 [Volvox africanus]|nr:hypothetical protein Vafri_20814 [Volvox africanus]